MPQYSEECLDYQDQSAASLLKYVRDPSFSHLKAPKGIVWYGIASRHHPIIIQSSSHHARSYAFESSSVGGPVEEGH